MGRGPLKGALPRPKVKITSSRQQYSLPTFLKRWDAGDSAIEAAFAANQNVTKEMGDSPAKSLAMNVFGDALRRRGAGEQLHQLYAAFGTF